VPGGATNFYDKAGSAFPASRSIPADRWRILRDMKYPVPAIALLVLVSLVPARGAAAQTTRAAATTTATAGNPGVEEWVRKLSADEWRTREEAQQALVALGDGAVERLRQLLKSAPDPETRARAESTLAQIDENRTSGPSSITLHFDQASPKDVLEEIKRQAGDVSVGVWPDNLFAIRALPNITLHVDRQPFWVALKEFCLKAGLGSQMMGPDRGLMLLQGAGNDMMDGPSVFSGPFMVVARRATEMAEVAFARPNSGTRNMTLEFAVLAEPKLQIVGHVYQARLTEVVDEAGNSLKSQAPVFESFQADGSPLWLVQAQLSRTDSPGSKKIARLRGSTRVVLQARSELWEIPNAVQAKGLSKTVGERTYTVDAVTPLTASTYQVRVTATRRAVPNRMDNYVGLGTLKLTDAEGRELVRRTPDGGGGGGPDRINYTYLFDANAGNRPTGPPTKLSWRLPVETKTVEVPFEFTDLPLP
jgi:hypothetical protein